MRFCPCSEKAAEGGNDGTCDGHPNGQDPLAAFVDGELSPEEAAEVVMHLADHPADQTYVDDLFAANAALAEAFSAQ